jgi:hypothetical protein
VSRHRADNYPKPWSAKRTALQRSAARYADRGVAPPEAKNPAKSSGCVSKQRSPSGSVIHGCLLRVQICAVGFSHEVSSNVPARTERNIPPNLGLAVSHEPQSRHIHRVDTRPLSPVLCARCGSPAVRRNASSVTTTHGEGATRDLLTLCAVAAINQSWCLRDLITEPAALAAAGQWKFHRSHSLLMGLLSHAVTLSWVLCGPRLDDRSFSLCA